jgi:hypothetical protein
MRIVPAAHAGNKHIQLIPELMRSSDILWDFSKAIYRIPAADAA